MARNDNTSAIVDGVLKLLVGSSALAVVIIAPNALMALEKPLDALFRKLDKRAMERELHRVTNYMKKQGLVKGDYEHGLVITKAGKKRARRADFDNLSIPTPEHWDEKWRLVLLDIPEEERRARADLTRKLRQLGFQLLQQSVWVHPFPCRTEIEVVTSVYGVEQYVTYIETVHIDHGEMLINRFSSLLRQE